MFKAKEIFVSRNAPNRVTNDWKNLENNQSTTKARELQQFEFDIIG